MIYGGNRRKYAIKSAVMPKKIVDLVWGKTAEWANQHKTEFNALTKFGRVEKALNLFLDFLRRDQQRRHLAERYQRSFNYTFLRRALNEAREQENGATFRTLNLFSLFVTNGKTEEYEQLLKDNNLYEPKYIPAGKSAFNPQKNLRKETLPPQEKEEIERQETQLKEKVKFTYSLFSNDNHFPDPEFPPKPYFTPKFPATRILPLYVPNYFEVFLKDEGQNPTGTHKDRMALEIKNRAIDYKNRKGSFPNYSIISAGSAAFSIQFFFKLYNVDTQLRVIVDESTNANVLDALRTIGCLIYKYDLQKELLNSVKIKEITENMNGIDITTREITDLDLTLYYDWLSYEILNQCPDYCFIPVGTMDLFINVIRILEREFDQVNTRRDPRFHSNMRIVKNCTFLGATSSKKELSLDKLFSRYLPHREIYKAYVEKLKGKGVINDKSGFYDVESQYIDKAMDMLYAQNVELRKSSHPEINFETSSIAGLALFLQKAKELGISKDSKVLIINTGKTKYNIRPEDFYRNN